MIVLLLPSIKYSVYLINDITYKLLKTYQINIVSKFPFDIEDSLTDNVIKTCCSLYDFVRSRDDFRFEL